MKNLNLPILVYSFTFGTVIENDITVNNNAIETIMYDVSSFCKLIQKGDFVAVKSLIKLVKT